MDGLHDRHRRDKSPMVLGEADLLAAMEQSDADVTAGLTVTLADVLAELDEAAERMEARRRT
jgi:hypothetical protein